MCEQEDVRLDRWSVVPTPLQQDGKGKTRGELYCISFRNNVHTHRESFMHASTNIHTFTKRPFISMYLLQYQSCTLARLSLAQLDPPLYKADCSTVEARLWLHKLQIYGDRTPHHPHELF